VEEFTAIADDLDELDRIDEELERWGKVTGLEKTIERASEISGEIEAAKMRIGKLEEVLNIVDQCDSVIRDYEKVLSLEDLVKAGLSTIEDVSKIDEEIHLVGQLIAGIENVETELSESEERKESLIGKYAERLSSLKRCPTCFSPIDEKTVKRIMEEA